MAEQLTDQERNEADALIAAWKQVCLNVREYETMKNDADELLRACYGDTQRTVTKITSVLRAIFNKTQWASNEWNKTVQVFMEGLSQKDAKFPDEMPKVLARKIPDLIRPFERISTENPSLSPFIRLLITLIGTNQHEVANHLCLAQREHADKLDRAVTGLREVHKRIRDRIAEKESCYLKAKSDLLHVFRVWTAQSETRMAYVRKHGIPLVSSVQNGTVREGSSSHATSPDTLRRRKKRLAVHDKQTEKTSVCADNQPWTITCVTHEGKHLESYHLTQDDDGTKLECLLEETFGRYAWSGCEIPKGRIAYLLRKILGTSPGQRHCVFQGTFRIKGKQFFALKPKKGYRILVRINDTDHSVQLMAGHRTELYSEIRRFKGSEK